MFRDDGPVLVTNEGVREKKPQVTLDLMSNSLFLYKEVKSSLLGESCSLSDGSFSMHPFIDNIDPQGNMCINLLRMKMMMVMMMMKKIRLVIHGK